MKNYDNKHGKISVSMMCADFLNLEKNIREFEACGVEYLHIDIMDGSFAPNYTLGVDFCKILKKATSIPLDLHLMINEPERKLEWFADAIGEGDYVSIHYESTAHVQRALRKIRDMGANPIIALNPATPINTLENILDDIDAVLIMTVNPGYAGQALIPATVGKIRRLRKYLDFNEYTNIAIQADGNVSFENAKIMREAGVDIFVAGSSSVFISTNITENIRKLRENIK